MKYVSLDIYVDFSYCYIDLFVDMWRISVPNKCLRGGYIFVIDHACERATFTDVVSICRFLWGDFSKKVEFMC